MASHIEQLSSELFFIIFSYLEIHDLVKAFGYLNSYFHSLLMSLQLHVYARINRADDSIWSLVRIESIRSLIPDLLHPEELTTFFRQNAPRFIHLTNLKLNIKNDDVDDIALLLSHLVNLQRLSINELSGNADQKNELTLLSAILRIPSLKVYEWQPFNSNALSLNTIEEQNLAINPSIEKLYIKNDVATSFVLFLFEHLPHMRILRLQYLSWLECTTSCQAILQMNLTVVAIGTANTSFSNLQQVIRVVPHLRCFRIIDWHMRDEEDRVALFNGRLERLLHNIACVHVGTVVETWDDQRDEVYKLITSCSWLTIRGEYYDYMDACNYFDIAFTRFNPSICCRRYSNIELNTDFSLRKLGFRIDYVI